MANSEHVGLMQCPLCGGENATVHQQRTGTKKGRLYYRCYTEPMGVSMRCGTIQCIGPAGQEVIKARMRPIGNKTPEKPPETVADSNDFVPGRPIASQGQEVEPAQEKESQGGLLGWMFGDDEE